MRPSRNRKAIRPVVRKRSVQPSNHRSGVAQLFCRRSPSGERIFALSQSENLLAFLKWPLEQKSDHVERAMSALGQKQTYAVQNGMSALPPRATAKADFRNRSCPLCLRKRTCAVQ